MVIKSLCDGGYLAGTYGSGPWGVNAWSSSRALYSMVAGSLIMMDSIESHRKNFDPDYKAQRAERAEHDEHKAEVRENMRRFRQENLLGDGSLRTLHVNGFEADDLLAIAVAHNVGAGKPVKIIGADKDLLQLPANLMYIVRTDNTAVTIENFASKQAKAIQHLITMPWHVLLTLAMFGDKSDNIPRAVPARSGGSYADLYRMSKPFSTAAKRLGQTFINNLWLAVLPSPAAVSPHLTPDILPAYLDEHKEYWLQHGDYKITDDIMSAFANSMMEYGVGEVFGTKKSKTVQWDTTDARVVDTDDSTQSPVTDIDNLLSDNELTEEISRALYGVGAMRRSIARLSEVKKALDEEHRQVLEPLTSKIEERQTSERQSYDRVRKLSTIYFRRHAQQVPGKLITVKRMKRLNIREDQSEALRLEVLKQAPTSMLIDQSKMAEVVRFLAIHKPGCLLIDPPAVIKLMAEGKIEVDDTVATIEYDLEASVSRTLPSLGLDEGPDDLEIEDESTALMVSKDRVYETQEDEDF